MLVLAVKLTLCNVVVLVTLMMGMVSLRMRPSFLLLLLMLEPLGHLGQQPLTNMLGASSLPAGVIMSLCERGRTIAHAERLETCLRQGRLQRRRTGTSRGPAREPLSQAG